MIRIGEVPARPRRLASVRTGDDAAEFVIAVGPEGHVAGLAVGIEQHAEFRRCRSRTSHHRCRSRPARRRGRRSTRRRRAPRKSRAIHRPDDGSSRRAARSCDRSRRAAAQILDPAEDHLLAARRRHLLPESVRRLPRCAGRSRPRSPGPAPHRRDAPAAAPESASWNRTRATPACSSRRKITRSIAVTRRRRRPRQNRGPARPVSCTCRRSPSRLHREHAVRRNPVPADILIERRRSSPASPASRRTRTARTSRPFIVQRQLGRSTLRIDREIDLAKRSRIGRRAVLGDGQAQPALPGQLPVSSSPSRKIANTEAGPMRVEVDERSGSARPAPRPRAVDTAGAGSGVR